MTRQKLEKTIDWALARQGMADRQRIVAAVADAIDLTLSMEDGESGPARPILDANPIPDALKPDHGIFSPLPPSPSVIKSPEVQPRLAIVPPSEPISPMIQPELNQKESVFTPPREGSGPRGEPQFWKPEQMSKVLHDNTPARLKITIEHPERGPVPVWLERNVVVSPGFESVKLSYKHTNAPDEYQVAESFSITQKELPVSQALEKIQKNAAIMYAPRQRGLPRYSPQPQPIVAQTPVFDPDNPRDPTPHDSV